MSNPRYDDRGRHEHGHEGQKDRHYRDAGGGHDEHHRSYGHAVGAGDYRPFGSTGPGGEAGGGEGPHRYASRRYDDHYGHRGHPDEFGGYREDQGREPPGMRERGLRQSGGGWRSQGSPDGRPDDHGYRHSGYEQPGGHDSGSGARGGQPWHGRSGRGRDDWNGQRDWGGSESEWSSGRSGGGGGPGGQYSGSGHGRSHGRGSGHLYGDPGGHGGGLDARGWDRDASRGEPGFTGGFSGQAPKGYTRSDERIREDVCERLTHEDVDAGHVEVVVSDGTVTLSGSVGERWMKHRMEDIADACSGVRDVRNDLRVQHRSQDGGHQAGRGNGGADERDQSGKGRAASAPGSGSGSGRGKAQDTAAGADTGASRSR